jgi:putative transposase
MIPSSGERPGPIAREPLLARFVRPQFSFGKEAAMRPVFCQLYYHVVWTTKNREPQLADTLRPALFEAIQETCRRLGCRLHAINAVEDHVHVALEVPPAQAVATVVGRIKGASAHAMNQLRSGTVHWQDGYGVITFRRAELARVVRYIATQEALHQSNSLSPLLETWHESDVNDQPAG